MPFTLAHPAIVLPINWLPKKWFSLTGLVIGSMIPDFESFIRLRAQKTYSHTLWGSVWMGMPAGILLAFVFHNIVKGPMVRHLPTTLQRRFRVYLDFHWDQYFSRHTWIVLASFITGIASHFFWDSFSHYDGFVVEHIPALQRNLLVFGASVKIPFLIQYVNSILGFIIVAVAIYQLPEEDITGQKTNGFPFWIITAILTLAIVFIRTRRYEPRSIDDMAVLVTAALVYAVIASASFLQLQHKLNTRSASGYNNN